MAVPSQPSIASRALYYGYAIPALVAYVSPLAPNNVTFVPSNLPGANLPGDVSGPGGQPLPAIVVSVSGVAPDYQGTIFHVLLPDGTTVVRKTGFQSNQPLLNTSTWTTQGSNSAQAHWQLQDALA
jgi:hypothetical protein